MTEQKSSSEDVIRWPDGTWCLREQLAEMQHMSDDCEVLYYQTTKWFNFMYMIED